jgi:hypothetical protein
VAPSRESSVLALATTDIPVSPHTSNGEILAIVDSGTSKHILQCRTLLANAKEAHVAVSSFAGDTSRSTYSGDLLCTVRTEDGQLLPLSDTSSALVVPDAKRPLWSVRHAQLAGHEIVLGNRPGLLLQGNPRYFVPFVNCPDTGLWLIRLLFTTGSILSTWLRTVLLKTQDSKITNVLVTSPSSVCVNLTSMVLHHQRRNA